MVKNKKKSFGIGAEGFFPEPRKKIKLWKTRARSVRGRDNWVAHSYQFQAMVGGEQCDGAMTRINRAKSLKSSRLGVRDGALELPAGA